MTDLCIVGAGPAGISIARELDGSGIRICLLESGAADVERRVQRQSRGESDGYPVHLLRRSRVRAFGGTLRHPRVRTGGGWAARALDPVDFEARWGVPDSGWPFDHGYLLPYYERARRVCGLAPRGPADEAWRPVRGSDVEPTLYQLTQVDFSDVHDTLVSSPNVRLLLRCRAVDFTTDPTGRRVETVTAVRADGSKAVVRPRAVVLAAGGIENARLLLTADAGRGLGNEHDVVGRYFAERLALSVGYVVPYGPGSVRDAGFFDRRGDVSGAIRVVDRVQRDKGFLNCAFSLVPRPAAVATTAVGSLSTLHKAMIRRPLVDGFGARVRHVATGLDHVADFALSRVVARPRVLVVRAQGEQAPNRDSRVTLGSRRDDLGIPVARVSWRMADTDIASIATSLGVVDAALRAGRFGFVASTLDRDPATLVEGAHHHLGTTRMHADPRKGVVDADCRVHSVRNLYVTGSSVFPTYGLSNPTLTIVALALRLADHLRGTLGRG
ncbi:MAG: GMC family oxidoreductase [Streptosporangiales bacterium]|nr:GMC family oxidoreductase [Streptosporangiales bacterium]MBO0890683.1 GMC family oxidoreductase [Acidothermales bacterium]